MEGSGGPRCAAREQVVPQTLSRPFCAFVCSVLMLKVGRITWQEEPVMGMAGLAATDVASLWAAGLWLPQEFPLFLPGES